MSQKGFGVLVLLLCSLMIAAMFAAPEPTLIPLQSGSCGETRYESGLLVNQDLTLYLAESFTRRMLKGGRARVEMVWLAADRDDFNEEWTGKLSSEVDYAYWYSLYRRTRGQLKPMAQLTKAEMGTVLRVRDSRGVHRQVLEGSDPLDFRVNDQEVRILEVRPGKPPVDARWGQSCKLIIYATSKANLSEEQGIELSRQVQVRFGVERVEVNVDRNGWFMYSSSFPVVYRFGPVSVPPNKSDYDNSFKMHCGNTGPLDSPQGISCITWPME